MNGRRPIGRIMRGHALALGIALGSGCAQPVSPVGPSVAERELASLRVQLGAREQTIQQLEGRLALLEAEQRALRGRVAQAERADREPPRAGASAAKCPAPEPSAREERALQSESEPRPLLRLHADRKELSSTWTPPTTHARLQVAPLPPNALVQAAAAPAVAARREEPLRSQADERYERALDLMARREFAEALRELDEFLRTFPQDARGARVQLLRGELLFGQREYARALVAYELAYKREPAGAQAAECLLRIARCHFQLGAGERGRAALSQLRARFPDSEAARRVDQVLREDS